MASGKRETVVTMRMERFIHLQSFYMVSLEISLEKNWTPERHMRPNKREQMCETYKADYTNVTIVCVSI